MSEHTDCISLQKSELSIEKPDEVILRPLGGTLRIGTEQATVHREMQAPATLIPPGHGGAGNTTNGKSSPGSGRIKAPPVCRIPALRKENISAAELSKLCFAPEEVFAVDDGDRNKVDSEECHESDDQQNISDRKCELIEDINGKDSELPNETNSEEWEAFKKSILQRTESRNGRDLQRFSNDLQTGHLLRLTTGCVPIMKDGSILLVSSSRKEEWILPKGGWESDEMLHVSAMRESYEEGGILGVLGPSLTEIEYETRKAKKRRLEMESLQKKYEIGFTAGLTKESLLKRQSAAVSIHSTTSSLCMSEDDMVVQNHGSNQNGEYNAISPSNTIKDSVPLKIKIGTNKRENTLDRPDDTASLCSVTSDGSMSSSHVRMSMFPLYVLDVQEQWPESGRARKVVDIDTAIELMVNRPEFQEVLIEVKEKGYHLKLDRRTTDYLI